MGRLWVKRRASGIRVKAEEAEGAGRAAGLGGRQQGLALALHRLALFLGVKAF